MKTTSRFALLTAALLSTAAMAAPSARTIEPRSESVKYSVSAAQTPEGAVSLYAKLKGAAVRVCSDLSYGASIDRAGFDACVKDTLTDAVGDVGSPLVAALHLQATGRPAAAH